MLGSFATISKDNIDYIEMVVVINVSLYINYID